MVNVVVSNWTLGMTKAILGVFLLMLLILTFSQDDHSDGGIEEKEFAWQLHEVETKTVTHPQPPKTLGYKAPANWNDVEGTTYNVREYGARHDTDSLQTPMFQKAIDAAAQAGGGLVTVPTGTYLISSLVLKSNVILYLQKGAVLLASGHVKDYNPKHLHLFSAENARNITIAGYGVIDGNAQAFFSNLTPKKQRLSPLIDMRNIKDLVISGITIREAPGWTIRPKNCINVFISKIMIVNDRKYINTDGIDPDSSSNVIIEDCYISAGDDAIVIKSSNYDIPYDNVKNVTVRRCTLISSASALKIGTESFGNFQSIRFSDVSIYQSRTGIAIMVKDGGAVKDVSFERITISTQPKWGSGVEWPIYFSVEKRMMKSKIGLISDVELKDVKVMTKGRVFIVGYPGTESIVHIRLNKLQIHLNGVEDRSSVPMLRGSDEVDPSIENGPDYGSLETVLLITQVRDVQLHTTIDWSMVNVEMENRNIDQIPLFIGKGVTRVTGIIQNTPWTKNGESNITIEYNGD